MTDLFGFEASSFLWRINCLYSAESRELGLEEESGFDVEVDPIGVI